MVQFQHTSLVHENGVASIKDVDFIIKEGEFVFLIGPSGSGKTTIIELLIRDQKSTDGKIFFNDVDITNISRNSVYKLRRQIGVIFQDFKLIPDKTAFENVAFAMEAAGKSNQEIKETVPYVLDIVGLGNRMEAFPKQLSGGEKQRVAIARAISNNPKLLIADEPTGNLDPASAWDIVQILTKINNWGTTVIMSTHGTDIVNTLNKRVIQLEDGVILRDDNEGQYEFSETVSKEQIEEILRQNKKADAEPKKSTFKLKLGKDLNVKETKTKEETIEKKKSKNENNNSKKKVKLNLDIEVSPDESIEEQVSEIDEKYAETKVEFLNLPNKIISKIQKEGYTTVKELIEDGAEVLSELESLSEDEVVAIAQSIDKLVNKI